MNKMSSSDPTTAAEVPDIEEQIRVRAYLLAEIGDIPGGSAEEYWHRARQQIDEEAGRSGPWPQANEKL